MRSGACGSSGCNGSRPAIRGSIGQRRLGAALPRRPARCRAGSCDFEHRARLAAAVADRDLAVQPLDQRADDEQPQAGAGLRAFQLAAQPHEAAEDLAPQLGRNAAARCR